MSTEIAVTEEHQTLVKRQLELEERMYSMGVEQYHKAVREAVEQGQESRTSYGRSLIAHNLKRVKEGIDKFLEEGATGKAARRGVAGKYIKKLPPETTALITLKTVLDSLSSTKTLQAVVLSLGLRIEDEVKHRTFEEQAPGLFRYFLKEFKDSTSYTHQRNVLAKVASNHDLELPEPWSQTTRFHVGMKLIDLLIQETGLIEVVEKKNLKKTQGVVKIIVMTDVLSTWLEKHKTFHESMSPKFLPMLIKPLHYSNFSDGGYLKHPLYDESMLKIRNKEQLKILKESESKIPFVYESINKIQDTSYRINKKVYRVIESLWASAEEEIAGLPSRFPTPLPPKPEDIATNKEARVIWRTKAAKVHEHNNKAKGKRLQVARILWLAEMFKDEKAIYFPLQLDFRGRMYAQPMYLNPQGMDLAKGLLTFATGKPINDFDAAGWLAIHGAGKFGYDKVSLRDRIGWVEEREELILKTAEDPLEDLWWAEADSPVQFLAFCFEWAGFLKEGLGYVSHLPVSMDATCSGLQHFAAMTRDEKGGSAVNLTPSETVADIYQDVCEVFKRLLTEKLSSTEIAYTQRSDEKEIPEGQLARWWLDLKPDRKTTKRQVMVLPYGATLVSCKDYTLEWAETHRKTETPWSYEDSRKACGWAGELIWQAMHETVAGPRKAMAWLQSCAGLAASYGKDVVWRTPLNWPVVHRYTKQKALRIETRLKDVRTRLTVKEDCASLSKSRMKSSISPNFVHSMDGAHMQLSVLTAADNGVTHFAVVHDDAATHAADAPTMATALREAFVDLYSDNDVLASFLSALKDRLPPEAVEKLPTLLPKGVLDLKAVHQSDFFFS